MQFRCDWCDEVPPKNTHLKQIQVVGGRDLVCESCLKAALRMPARSVESVPTDEDGQMYFGFMYSKHEKGPACCARASGQERLPQ